MKKIWLFLIILFVSAHAYGQGELDAYRLSSNDLRGTARTQAMGGAFGALGGDVGAISINPAGIGLYRSSEVVATMGFSNVSSETTGANKDSKTKFNFDNISYVGYFPLGKDDVQSINFGFSFNRLKNFDKRYSSSSDAEAYSLSDYMAVITGGTHVSYLSNFRSNAPWLGVLGYQAYLINPEPVGNGTFYDDSYVTVLKEGETINKSLRVREEGYIDSYDFTLGTNVSDRLFLGLSFSLTDMFFRYSSSYDESFERGGGLFLGNHLETEGSGYQLKVGAIYRPVDQLRIGVSYHSPTWYSLTDYPDANLIPFEIYDDQTGERAPEVWTPEDAYTNYKFRTPYSWTFSVAGVIGTRALISLDYEMKDYSAMNLEDNMGYKDPYGADNRYIEEDFKIASTLRAGLEYKFTPQFAGRLGYAWVQNPYDADFADGKKEAWIARTMAHYVLDGDVNFITAGIGYRFTPRFYMDLAFVYKQQKSDLYYYSPLFTNTGDLLVDSPSIELKNKTYRGSLTLGYKF